MAPYKIDSKTGLAILNESVVLPHVKLPTSTIEHLSESLKYSGAPDIIYPMFHALRADTITRNKTFYKEETLRGNSRKTTGMYSMLRPYPIPFLKSHDTYSSEVYGRVINAFMQDGALDGKKAVTAILAVPDRTAIEGILNGTWLTVSMGSRTEEVSCSICGQDLIAGSCEHFENGDEEFYAVIGAKGFKFMEISSVAVPSDPGAQLVNKDVLDPSKFRMFASNSARENVYDLEDPLHRNLLESSDEGEKDVAISIFESSSWLLNEFKRKKHIAMDITPKGDSMNTTKGEVVRFAEQTELPDSAFGVIYTESESKKVIRRFPIHPDVLKTSEQKEYVASKVRAAKDIVPEDKEKILAQLEAYSEDWSPVCVEVDRENYRHLLELLDELASDLVLSQEPCEEVQEAISEAVTEEATTTEPEVQEVTEVAETSTEDEVSPEDLEEAMENIKTLSEQLSRERSARKELLVEALVVAKRKETQSKTIEDLTAFYESFDVSTLEALRKEANFFSSAQIDVTQVEQIENPLPVLEKIAVEEVSEEGSPGSVPSEETASPDGSKKLEEDLLKLAEKLGLTLQSPSTTESGNE